MAGAALGILAVIGFLSIATMLAVARSLSWREMMLPTVLFAAAFAASWLPQIVAWGAMHTNSDTVLVGMCMIITAGLWLIVEAVAAGARLVSGRRLAGAPAE